MVMMIIMIRPLLISTMIPMTPAITTTMNTMITPMLIMNGDNDDNDDDDDDNSYAMHPLLLAMKKMMMSTVLTSNI